MSRFFILLLLFVLTYFSQIYCQQPGLLVYEPVFRNHIYLSSTNQLENNKMISYLNTGDSLFLNGESAKACEFYNRGVQFSRKKHLQWCEIIYLNRLGFTNYMISHLNKSYDYYTNAKRVIQGCKGILDSLAYIEALFFYKKLDPLLTEIKQDSVSRVLNSLKYDKLETSRRIKLNYLYIQFQSRIDENSKNDPLRSVLKEDVRNYAGKSKAFWDFIERCLEAENFDNRSINEIAFKYKRELLRQVTTQKEFKEFSFDVKEKMASSYYSNQQYDKAIELLKDLVHFADNNPSPNFYFWYLRLGYSYFMVNDPVLPEFYYKKAEKLLKKFHISDNRLGIVYHFMALYNTGFNKYSEKSMQYSLKAAAILEKHPDTYLATHIYYKIKSYYYKKHDFINCANYCEYFLTDIDSILSISDIQFKKKLPVILLYDIPEYLKWRAICYFLYSKYNNWNLQYLEKSAQDFERLEKLWDRIFQYIDNYEEYKVTLLASFREGCNNYIDMAFAYYQKTGNPEWIDKMFILSQKSKLYLLNTYLNDRFAQKIGGIPPDTIQKVLNIKKELDELNYSQGLSSTNSEDKNVFNVSSLIEKYNEYDLYISKLQEWYPAYALHRNKETGIPLKEIRKKLDEDQALIEYHIATDGFFTFYIDKKNFKVIYYKLLTFEEIPDKCKRYFELLNNPNGITNSKERKRELYNLSGSLYQLLIAPIEKEIIGKRLIIVPDLELNLVPFETLISKKPTEKAILNNDIPDYLVFSNAVSYLYSSSQVNRNSSKTIYNAKYAGFAPEYKNKTVNKNGIYLDLPQLPGAFDEVNAAKVFFRGKVYQGNKANKKNFFNVLAHFDIIHLAMHTSIDGNEPMNSELIFTIDSLNQDQQLHAYEVYSHENNIQMAVLSACNTAKGKLKGGEGVYNIARAFFLAGIPNVIVTNWSISDKSSAHLMNSFYENLSESVPSDISMQKSKIEFLTKGDPALKDPYYWAAYNCYGISTFVPPMRNVSLIYIAGTLLLFSVLIIGFKRRRTKI